jgi:nucleolar protein 12
MHACTQQVNEHGNQNLMRKACIVTGKLNSAAKDSVNAYVVFTAPAAATAALGANGRELEGHHLRVDSVDGFPPDPKRSVFLGNLPFDVKEEEVRVHFAAGIAGAGGASGLEAVRLVRDRETQMGKGFGYVLLKDKAGVGAALRLHGTLLRGRQVRVTVCGKRTKGRQGGGEDSVGKAGYEGRRAAEGVSHSALKFNYCHEEVLSVVVSLL